MKKDVLISIKGIIKADGEDEELELTTVGRFYHKNEKFYICYEESEVTGFEGSFTTLKVEDDQKVTMLRNGKSHTQLIVEKGKRHMCQYDTGYGSVLLGVSSDTIRNDLNLDGGNLYFKYSLDVNAALQSENEVYINVRECNQHHV